MTMRLPPLIACIVLSTTPVSAAQALLSSAAEVRALTEEEARTGVRVKLRGVVMGEADPVGIAFIVQDHTEGIYVQGPGEAVTTLVRGDLVEIEGQSDPGGFAPYVVADSVRVVGREEIPRPIQVSLHDLDAGRMDAKWVEFTGVVHSVAPKVPEDIPPPPPGTRYQSSHITPGSELPVVKMEIASGSSRVAVQIYGDRKPEEYVDAEVRVRGLCFNLHNHNRQFVGPFVQVPRGVDIEVLRAPLRDPFDGPPRPIASLLQFAQLSGEQGHRVHVQGVVLHHQPGSALWISDGKRSLRVDTKQPEALTPGDRVDVAGFPARGGYSAVLEDALFRKRGSETPPGPEAIDDASDALQHDAGLVRIDAKLTEVIRFPDSVSLTLEWSGTTVRASMRLEAGTRVPEEWEPGSTVQASGICTVLPDSGRPLGGLWEPRAFELLLRSPGDLHVLQPPPWWRLERVVWLLAGFLALAVAAVAVVSAASRRKTKDQEYRRRMAEAEFTAILNERNRVAREIHDTLSQSLGAISVQLELARGHSQEFSPSARNHLGSAQRLARAALAEARESIWNMRSQVLENHDLAEALERILKQLTDGTAIRGEMRSTGSRRRLSPVVENNLLRIGQEAITNAAKHAQPKRITVNLEFDGRTVHLTVEDDGQGFMPERKPESDRGHFGLIGIRERVELLGGSVNITSQPGKGTKVQVTVTG